jgi:hypothetical protein
MCHPIGQTPNTNMTLFNKCIIFYNPSHNITSMKEHIVDEHGVVLIQYKTQKKEIDEIIKNGL